MNSSVTIKKYDRKRKRAMDDQVLSPHNSKGYNGGLLCCMHMNGQLHILCGSEYRNSSRLTESQRQKTSHRKENRLLQLVIPGGRHKRDESVLDTVVREFWEETGRIVDRLALLQCLHDRAHSFEFKNARYQLIIALDAVHNSLPQVFSARVLEYGYPTECLRQLYWIPWTIARQAAVQREMLCLSNDLEPTQCVVPFSGFTASMLANDRRVVDYLDSIDQPSSIYLNPRLQGLEQLSTVSDSSTYEKNSLKQEIIA